MVRGSRRFWNRASRHRNYWLTSAVTHVGGEGSLAMAVLKGFLEIHELACKITIRRDQNCIFLKNK